MHVGTAINLFRDIPTNDACDAPLLAPVWKSTEALIWLCWVLGVVGSKGGVRFRVGRVLCCGLFLGERGGGLRWAGLEEEGGSDCRGGDDGEGYLDNVV